MVRQSIFWNSGYNPLHDAWFELDDEPKDKITIHQNNTSSTTHWSASNIFNNNEKDALNKFHQPGPNFLKSVPNESMKNVRNEKKKVTSHKETANGDIDKNIDLIFGSASKSKS